jgi:uncharacterized protein
MNPFLISNYVAPEYFCDREKEIATLAGNIAQRSHTAFFAQRRIGKTALIQHLFHGLRKKKAACLYLDLYPTRSMKEFADLLATGIYGVFPKSGGIGRKFLEAIRLLRPVLSFDQLDGSPQLSLDVSTPAQVEHSIPQLLRFLDSQKKEVVLALDEFQQVLSYKEDNAEAVLRSVIQELKHVSFIFCGSNQEMMGQIFNSSKRPFYASAKNIHLGRIAAAPYAEFTRKHFTKNGREISAVAIELVLALTERHTYYTQRLCHDLFAGGHKRIGEAVVRQTFAGILSENENIYYQYRNLLTTAQWKLLSAVAIEGTVSRPYSQDFIYKHRLGLPANVRRSLEALVQKEMVHYETAAEQPYYEVYDKFLRHWLRSRQPTV